LTAVFELTLDEIDEAIVEAFMEAADVDADVQFPADSSQSLAAHHDKIAIQSKSVMRTARTDPVVPDIPLTYCEMDALQLSRLAADSDLYSRFYIVAAPSDKQLNIRSSDGALKVAVDESVKVADESNVVEKVLDEPIGSNCRGGGGTAEIPIEFTDDKHDEDELDEELAFYTGTYQSTGTATETSDDAHDEDVESEAESTVVVQHSCLANENRAHDELPLLPDAFDEWMDDLVAERKALGCAFHDSCVFGEPICVY
jgi:hypothetical protein